jgi:hypothetical protein
MLLRPRGSGGGHLILEPQENGEEGGGIPTRTDSDTSAFVTATVEPLI